MSAAKISFHIQRKQHISEEYFRYKLSYQIDGALTGLSQRQDDIQPVHQLLPKYTFLPDHEILPKFLSTNQHLQLLAFFTYSLLFVIHR